MMILDSVSPSILPSLIKWGWLDNQGNSKVWFDWQRPGHDNQFQEPRERKPTKTKFVKKGDYNAKSKTERY
jgi:hypothetical protein